MYAARAVGEGRILHRSEIAFPHEPHTQIFDTPTIFIDTAALISNTICFDYVRLYNYYYYIKKVLEF